MQPYQFAAPIGSLEAYIHWVNRIPLLNVEEEKQLAEDLFYRGNVEAGRPLVLSHLRFVVRIAKGYAGYGLPQNDLIQEGNIGLMKAVKKFNPEMGVRLVSFAVHWIKAEIHEFILRNIKIVKIATTKSLRKLFFHIKKAAKNLTYFNNTEVANLAAKLDVSEQDVRNMEERLQPDKSLDPIIYSEEEEGQSPIHYLEDNRYDPAKNIEADDWYTGREQRLHEALKKLDARSQEILKQRWLSEDKATLHMLATQYGISPERVRQLEKNAMSKMKDFLE